MANSTDLQRFASQRLVLKVLGAVVSMRGVIGSIVLGLPPGKQRDEALASLKEADQRITDALAAAEDELQ